jgi:hypothetical protein
MVLVVDEQRGAELRGELKEVDTSDMQVAPLVDRRRTREEMPFQGCSRDIVVGRHRGAEYGSIRPARVGGD